MRRIILITSLLASALYSVNASEIYSSHMQDSTLNANVSDSLIILDEPAEDDISRSKIGEKTIEIFKKSPTFVLLLYIVILYSIITLISLTIIILIKRTQLIKREELKSRLDEEYQQLLIEYVFSSDDNNKSFEILKKIASDDYKRQILINQIIEISINIKGDKAERTKNLYLELGLKQDSLRKAYSKKWHENIKGFRELAFMNIREANERIFDCLNSQNEILRMEAQISLVRLSDDNPYEFLYHLEKPLALWEQITLHELVTMHNLNTPQFNQWFTSENLSIVIFSLQMVSWFKQYEAKDGILELLRHEDEGVRFQTIEVCGDLQLEASLPVLKDIYDGETYKNKLEILRSFGRTPVDEHLEYLNEVLDKEEDVQLQIAATKAMENLGETGISRLIKLMKSKTEFKNYQIIIRHVLDGRIY